MYFAIMLQAVYKIRYFLEKRGFYVSSRLADRLGMRAKSVRLFFIYASFATMGIGFAVYLTLAFLLKLKDLVFTKRTSVFDLWEDYFNQKYTVHYSCCLWFLWPVFLVLNFLFVYNWIDAAYMTVITITTIGFGELHPLSPFEIFSPPFLYFLVSLLWGMQLK